MEYAQSEGNFFPKTQALTGTLKKFEGVMSNIDLLPDGVQATLIEKFEVMSKEAHDTNSKTTTLPAIKNFVSGILKETQEDSEDKVI